LERVVFFQLPAAREIAAFRGNGLHLVDKLLFVFQQCVARFAVLFAFVWISWFTHLRLPHLLKQSLVWPVGQLGGELQLVN
jgi:hypothetical protein